MIGGKCGKNNPDGAAFCRFCGNRLRNAGDPNTPNMIHAQPQAPGHVQPPMGLVQPQASSMSSRRLRVIHSRRPPVTALQEHTGQVRVQTADIQILMEEPPMVLPMTAGPMLLPVQRALFQSG